MLARGGLLWHYGDHQPLKFQRSRAVAYAALLDVGALQHEICSPILQAAV